MSRTRKENKVVEVKVGKFTARIYKLDTEAKLVASVSIEVANLVVKGFNLIKGSNGLFLANPTTKYKDDYRDTAYFLDKELKEEIEDAIIEAYEKEYE